MVSPINKNEEATGESRGMDDHLVKPEMLRPLLRKALSMTPTAHPFTRQP